MEKISFQKAIPYLVALIIFYLLTLIFYYPILEGKRLKQHDIEVYKGASKDIYDFREKYGHEPLWTGSSFSGMPAYMTSVIYNNNVTNFFRKILLAGIPTPYGSLFICMVGFFILMLVLKVNPWLAMIGSIAYSFSSYLAIILQAGHNTKMLAIAAMAPVFAGIILAFRGKYLLGAAVTAIFLALEIRANHLQITYYLLLIVVIFGIAEFVKRLKEGQLPQYFKALGILTVSAILALGVNITNLMVTYEYLPYSTRGESELTLKEDDQTAGLDRSYATAWSYGIGETFTLLIPNAKGGASGLIGNNTAAMEKVDPVWRQNIANNNHYWGNQPSTSGPVYVGAVVMLLFILGLFILKGPMKWAMLIATVVSILFAWGNNFMWLTDLMLDYLPLYNKFRAVSMTLVIAELCIPVLAFMALYKIYKNPDLLKEKRKAFYISLGLTGGLTFIFAAMPSLFFDFISKLELSSLNEQMNSQPESAQQISMFMAQLEAARIAIFRADAWRSFGFIVATAALLFAWKYKKIPQALLIAGIGLVMILDLWPVSRRYLNESHFVTRQRAEKPFTPTQADLQILQDQDPNYRVMNLAVNTFNDASTSYFHKSIGGYHGAKMGRYQELIEYQIAKNNMKVLNMLNAKYFIVTDENTNTPIAQLNPGALGHAWFVPDYKIVENADSELMALSDFNPDEVMIVDRRYEDLLKDFSPFVDNYINDSLEMEESGDYISLTEYEPNRIIYEYSADKAQLTVFSEIFYSKGWKSYINGEEVPHFRANYVLRAMLLPPGNNTVEFVFKPESYYRGEKLSFASSSAMLLLLLLSLFYELYYKRRKQIKNP